MYSVEKYEQTARQAVAEGIVMLRNENKVLPIPADSSVALFGRSQFNYFKSGTGSGGLVNTAYVTGIGEAFENSDYHLNEELKNTYEVWLKDHPFDTGNGWAQEPWFQEEMPVSSELATRIAADSSIAVIVIGRTAGEDKDNAAEEGSYFLMSTEEEMIRNVCGAFEKTVVLLNVGNIMDMKWVEKYRPSAVLYVWQGGQEGGNGVMDVLTGAVSPSGKLTDTIAADIQDYPAAEHFGSDVCNEYVEDIYVGYRYFSTFAPDKVLYPFGYGLSYTEFEMQAQMEGTDLVKGVCVKVQVKNTGDCAGKEVVQVYCEAPQGKLGKATRVLCGFAKTEELKPGCEQNISIEIPVWSYASYDDSGLSGHKSCYVLEQGTYTFYVGNNVRDAVQEGSFELAENYVLEKLEEALAPNRAFERICPLTENGDGTYEIGRQAVPLRTKDPEVRRRENLPVCPAFTGDRGFKLHDVEEGKVSMEDFLAQLSDEELCCMVRGEGMCSPKVTPGTAAAFGGVTESLKAYGIPVACCADGPSGIRMDCGTIAFAMPNGTALACSFNEKLVEELYEWEGMELRKNKVDTLLGPGMNIHRHPLNGRNFEYFSEDPFVTGKMAAAQLRGMHRYGVTGTIKHFACNNQEFNRHTTESLVSERALREIYLKGYEIAVKEGNARSVMSTYGPVNGFWTAANYDLLVTILRREWGFTGIVMTDWWAKIGEVGKEVSVQNTAAMVRAQNDVYMVVSDSKKNSAKDNSMAELQKGTLTRAELTVCAADICRFLLGAFCYVRLMERETALDKELQEIAASESKISGTVLALDMEGAELAIPVEKIDTAKGSTAILQIAFEKKGRFRLDIECRASAESPELAQIPVSIFQDMTLVETISLTGAQKEWVKYSVELPNVPFNNTFFVKLFFGMSGMELRSGTLTLLE